MHVCKGNMRYTGKRVCKHYCKHSSKLQWHVLRNTLKWISGNYSNSTWRRHHMKTLSTLLVLCEWTWWRHQMETFSALLALCAGNSPVPVNSPHKGQWRGALIFSLICARINDWVNNREAGDLRCYRGHYDVIVMIPGQRLMAGIYLVKLPLH